MKVVDPKSLDVITKDLEEVFKKHKLMGMCFVMDIPHDAHKEPQSVPVTISVQTFNGDHPMSHVPHFADQMFETCMRFGRDIEQQAYQTAKMVEQLREGGGDDVN